MRKGRVCACIQNTYFRMMVDGQQYPNHHLAWLWVHGELPKGQLDHINGDRLDNRIANLREASQTENMGNCIKHRDNKSGYKGVFPLRGKRWQAQVCRNGVKHHLGTFETPEEAHAAYCDAASKVFGEFARTG